MGGVQNSLVTPSDFYRSLFILLESKRILTYPMHKEYEDECIASVLGLKESITTEAMRSRLSDYELLPAKSMVGACNSFLDIVRPIRRGVGDNFNDGHRNVWGIFSDAVEAFRDSFKNAIAEVERRYGLQFSEDTSKDWY